MFMEKNNEDLSCLRTHVLGAKSLLKNLGHLHLPEESQFSLVSPFVPGSLKEPGLQSITSRCQEGLGTVTQILKKSLACLQRDHNPVLREWAPDLSTSHPESQEQTHP